MQDNYITLTRDQLEQMTMQQLDDLLNGELEKNSPNGDTVRLILSVLWEREKDMPVKVTPGVQRAWAKYQRNVAGLESTGKRRLRFRSWVLKAASVAAVLCLALIAVPQEAEADSLFDKLARLTDSIVEFFSPGYANDNLTEYVFQTDNPGLQQLHDAVVELGVTNPVVPTWLPDGFELVECKTAETRKKTCVLANYRNNSESIILQYDIYDLDVSHEYHRDNTQIQVYEHYGRKYSIMRNNNRWVAIWFIDRVECSITLDCQEDTLHKILDSIYVMEENS